MKKYNFKKTVIIIILFFTAGPLLLSFLFNLFFSISNEKFSSKYIAYIENNQNEIKTLFKELDSIKQSTDKFYLNYHFNLNELYFEDSNKENELFIYNKENKIKNTLSKSDVDSFKYTSENNKNINVYFRKTTQFGICPDNLILSFGSDNNGINYYFINRNDTILFKNIPF